MKKLYIIGAFDRYNYGDILFPVVIKYYISTYRPDIFNTHAIEYISLNKSDLTKIGGVKTKRLSDLSEESVQFDVIISGGEVLDANIIGLYIDSSNNLVEMLFKEVCNRFVSKRLLAMSAYKKFNVRTDYPYIIKKDYFPNIGKIIYNSVGGCVIDTCEQADYIKQSLNNNHNYISVRDVNTWNNLNNKYALAPDSALLISDIFDSDTLDQLVNIKIKNRLDGIGNYIGFQISLRKYIKNKKYILNELDKFIKHGIKVVLTPIGWAFGHDDYLALSAIKKVYPEDCILEKHMTIYDIMYTISHSMYFVSSSLHGNITAMSYSIPHCGIPDSNIKVNAFLQTWDIEQQNKCIKLNDIYNSYLRSKHIDKNLLLSNTNRLKTLVKKNLKEIMNIIEELKEDLDGEKQAFN